MLKNNKLYNLIMISIFSALAIVVSLIEIPWGTSWLKLDLSDLIILISFLFLGFYQSIIICGFRFLIRFLLIALPTVGPVLGIFAEIVGLVATLILLLFLFISKKIVYKKDKLILKLVIWTIFTSLLFAFSMVILNFFFLTPMYVSMYGGFNLDVWNYKLFIE
ncbi:MAG: hypothetical protein LBV51_02565, partial [Acholeplasmatales bacterium]|nr:hypothetical protein [Acholeplasmatales bacterium]